MAAYNSLAVFLFSAIALIFVSGFSAGAGLLLLGSAVLLWKRPVLALKKDDYLLIAALSLYFFVNAAGNVFHAAPLREYDAPLRFLLVIPALLSLLAYPPKPAALWAGLAFGAIGAGLFAGWQHLITGDGRPGGMTNPIQYGNISILMGILCLSGLEWAFKQQRKALWIVLLVLGAVSGLLGSLLTSSRGSWLALPFCIGILAVHHTGAHGKRYIQAGLLALVALIALMWALPQSSVRARTQLAVQETQDYVNTGKADTSTGARLEMWRTAISMVPQHLWFGWGKQGYMVGEIALIREGKAAPVVGLHSHLHNEYLDALVKRGIAGLLALLGVFLVPLVLFSRQLKDANRSVHPYAIAGVLLCVSYMVFGLTQTFLTHNNGVMVFAFLSVMLWTYLRNHQRTAAGIYALPDDH